MATGVKSWDTTAANNDDADSTINWLEGQAPLTVNDSARAMMAAIAAWYALIDSGTVSNATVGGTANAITLTCSPTVDAAAAGQRYLFKYTSTGNTGAVTIAVDTSNPSATELRYKDVALISGDIATNDWVLCVYDGTRFQMLNPPRLSGQATDYATDTTGGDVADLFYFADASQGNASNKVTVQKLLDNALTSLTADATPDVADSLLTYDASAPAAKTTTITNFYKSINALTADATPDGAADYVATYDASASGGKKVLISSFGASAAQQETGTATTNFVTPGVQHRHNSAAKAVIRWDCSSGTPTISTTPAHAYNHSSFTDNGTGDATITIVTAFSAADYAFTGGAGNNDAVTYVCTQRTTAPTTTTLRIVTDKVGIAATDVRHACIVMHGDQ